jgi:hypothetical protein
MKAAAPREAMHLFLSLLTWWFSRRSFMEPLQEKRMQKRCAAEFIGTFLYIFLSESAAVNADTQGVVVNALGNGLTLAVLIWCFSGAHSPPCHPLPGSLTCKRAQNKAWKTILLLCFEVRAGAARDSCET